MSETKFKKLVLPPRAKLEQRSIYSLKPHPKQELFFPEAAAANINDLAADILANGLNEPLEITPDNRIISGHRRCRVLKKLHVDGHSTFASVQVKVRYDLAALGEVAIERRLLQANLNRRHLTVTEFARVTFNEFQLRKPTKGEQLKLKRSIAEQYNINVKTLERIWRLLDLPLELQRLVDVKKLKQRVALALLNYATPDEIEELRVLAVKEGPVGRQADRLVATREPEKLRKIDPRKILNSSAIAAADIHLHLAKLAEFITGCDNRRQLRKYRHTMGRIVFAANKLLEVLGSLPQLQGVDDEPPITLDAINWQAAIRGAEEQFRKYKDGEDDDPLPVRTDARPKLKLPPVGVRNRA
ncbi:ParB/RepB/Spo0J family partition protein [Anatilimnocola sp. NA78]|uniref:ParB/RepB/Spo0J family partition protein n=1 Tax=Anatilimnocola sp. NA78 TaxID=3415683 RepID=UPI003CE44D70